MRKGRRLIRVAMAAGCLLASLASAQAAQAPEISLAPAPIRYSFVEGDIDKFRAHHWIKEDYAGGMEDFSLRYDLPGEVSVVTEGHALVDENDMGAELRISKANLGFFHLDYSEFRKYYDRMGGVYAPFQTLRFNETPKELALDIGHLTLETGITLEELPKVTLLYEREFKDGAKSRLTWTPVREGSVTRNIGPSWQAIDEIVDTFAVKAEHQVRGFNLKGEQRWEFVRAEMIREEPSLSTTATATDRKIRVQDQEPETDLATTFFGAERWFRDDKAFTSAAYRFAHMNNHELESIFELTENRIPQNFANAKQIRNARADNDLDSHTWVANFMALPLAGFSVTTKLKSELIKRESNSTYPSDTTPANPDGIVNTTEVSANDSRAMRWGEGLALRFTRIPRTALYSEAELEQVRNWLSEDRQSRAGQSAANANEIFSRETITYVRRAAWTLGAHLAPSRFANVTAHFRQRRNNNDYDDKRETDPGANTARSAFMDVQNVHTNEFAARLALKLFRWLHPSFRYQFRVEDYTTRVENQAKVETDMDSHIITFDLVSEPLANLFTALSMSWQNFEVHTPAELAGSARTPAFEADVQTWLLSADYLLKSNLSLTGTLAYSWADNFNDFTDAGLPLGVKNRRLDLAVGLKWSLHKNISLEPKYGYYRYRADQDAEFGEYDAHVLFAELKVPLL